MKRMAKEVSNSKSGTTATTTATVEAVTVCQVERHGEAIVIPEQMTLKAAIGVLERQLKYDDETVNVHEVMPGFFLDACYAFNLAMKDVFGWSFAEEKVTETMFGMKREPPALISIATGVGKVENVPYGVFTVPSLEGQLETQSHREQDAPLALRIVAMVKRKDEARVRVLFATTRKYIQARSIYRGQAFKVRFRDSDGDRLELPHPQFLDLRDVKPAELIFDQRTDEAVRTNLFTPLEQSAACRTAGIPLKRGLLFPGPYGCGKTLVAYVTARLAVDCHWTFIYCDVASELRDHVALAHQYQPAVVFCEDIDRVMTGERTVEVDELLNIVDGIESKNVEIMVVLTTNHLERVHRAMLRPGRLDAVIPIGPPDQAAAERLIRLYARDLLGEGQEHLVAQAAKRMAGQIPAVIREMVERAKLSAIKLTGKPDLTGAALLDAASAMERQLALLEEKRGPALTPGDHIAKGVHGVLRQAFPSAHDYVVAAEPNSEVRT